MKINVIGKELKVTEAINNYVEKKMERIEKYFKDDDNVEAEATLEVEREIKTAEILVVVNGKKFRAATEDKDMYAAIDKDMDILEGQIRKAKTKKEKLMREGSIKNIEESLEKQPEIENEILKVAYYDIKPMMPEDAIMVLQSTPTHNFLAFINVETNKVNVLYKLKDGKNYGLVEPEA